jgi:hypothetical protein
LAGIGEVITAKLAALKDASHWLRPGCEDRFIAVEFGGTLR